MNFLERFLLNRIKKSNNIQDVDISDIERAVSEKRNEIHRFFSENRGNGEVDKVAVDFSLYTTMLEQLILERRLESGVSTLIYFIYTILGNVAGIIMSILVFISTTGYVGHLILLVSIMGGIAGIIIALQSMRKERKFINSLKKGI